MRRILRTLACSLLALILLGAPARAADWSSAELTATGDEAAALGDAGQAQLAWQRARLLDPDAVTGRPVAGADLSPLLPTWDWAWLMWGGLALTMVGVGGVYLSKRQRWSLAASVSGALVASTAALALHAAASTRDLAVFTEDTPVHVSPASTAPERGTLAGGELVRVGEVRGDYARVSSPAGSGWIGRSNLVAVVPDDR